MFDAVDQNMNISNAFTSRDAYADGIGAFATTSARSSRFEADGSPRKMRKRISQISQVIGHSASRRDYESRLLACSKRITFLDLAVLKYKYLRDYIGLHLDYSWRREAIASHYEILANSLTAASDPRLFANKLELWTATFGEDGSDRISVTLEPDRSAPLEGELQLSFVVNDQILASLTFLFVRGALLGYAQPKACVIGSLQGRPDTRTEIRRISKINHEISPFAVLMMALNGVCETLEIDNIVGISAFQQVAVRGEIAKSGQDYNSLWESMGGTVQTNGFYLLGPQEPKVTGTTLSSAHRRRAARKAAKKQAIGDAISFNFRDLLLDADAGFSQFASQPLDSAAINERLLPHSTASREENSPRRSAGEEDGAPRDWERRSQRVWMRSQPLGLPNVISAFLGRQ